MPIISSSEQLEVGRVYTQDDFPGQFFKWYHELHDKYTCFILRKATKEEYLAQGLFAIPGFDNYYEISMD